MFDGNGQSEINTSKIKRQKREVKALLYPMLLNFRTSTIAFWKVSRLSLFCPSGNSNMYMKMIREQWWNVTDRGKPQY
jgi:hypothetical protein